MEIIEINSPFIYSIKYDGEDDNEFDRLFSDWMDVEKISDLKEHVLQNIDRVRDWLKINGIMDSDDMNN